MKNNSAYFPIIDPKISLSEGIYLAKQQTSYLVIEHYAVILVGESLLRLLGYEGNHALVFHLVDKGIRVDWPETSGPWSILGQVRHTQVNSAIKRLKNAVNDSTFDLLSNNCEQFARYVTEGYKQSIQVQRFGLGTAIGIGLIFLSNWGDSD